MDTQNTNGTSSPQSEPYSDTAFVTIDYSNRRASLIDAAWDMEPSDEDLLRLEITYSDTLYPEIEAHAPADASPQATPDAPEPDEVSPDAAFERLNDAVNAVALLYRTGRRELLNEIDGTGQLASGETNAIAAGFLLLQYQLKNSRTTEDGPRAEDRLAEAMALYNDGVLNMEDAAKMAGLRRTKFKDAVMSRFGSVRSRGRAMGAQADAYRV
jgi:hypothetical protein